MQKYWKFGPSAHCIGQLSPALLLKLHQQMQLFQADRAQVVGLPVGKSLIKILMLSTLYGGMQITLLMCDRVYMSLPVVFFQTA